MAKDVFVRIKGDDDLSPKLKAIGAAAKSTAADLKSAGTSAKQAGDDAKRGGDSFKDYGDEMRNVGLAAGVLVAGLALSGQSFRDQEIGIRNLQRSYGDAADDMRQFAQQIQDTTNFSNDAGVQAANIAATLARNYGFAADEIQQVLQISADLAATSGLSLEDTTYRVVAALRGEAEAAEALGLTMNQAAIDHDNLTLSMSNQEAGHFRLNALVTQSAFAQGAAAEQADTFYGSLTDIAHGAQDAAQGFGEMLGPLGEAGAFASDNAIKFAAMGLAIGQLSKGASGLNDVSKAMSGVGLAANGLSLVTAAMTGPVGIVVAAGLAGLAIREFAGTIGPSFHEASGDAVASIDAVIEKIVELGDTSALAQTVLGLDTISASYQQVNDEANNAIGSIGDWIAQAAAMDDANADTVEGLMLSSAEFDNLTQHQRDVIDANKDGTATLTELTNAQATFNDEAINSQRILDGLSGGADELSKIFTMTGEGAAEAKAAANEYTQALLDGQLSSKDYELGLQGLIQRYGELREDALASGDAINDNATALDQSTGALIRWLDAGGEVHTLTDDIATSMQDLGEESVTLGAAIADKFWDPFELRAINALDNTARSMAAMGALSAGMGTPGDTGAFDAMFQGVKAGAGVAAAAQEGLARGIANASDAMTYQVGESQRLTDELDKLAKDKAEVVAAATVAMTSAFDAVTTAVTGTTKALDSGFQVVVGNTNAIASASQGVADWATELINVQGEYGKMDDLLKQSETDTRAAVISQEQYNAAQAAYTPIMEANTRIQDDMLSIQVQQAPVIAELAQQQADYLDTVTQMNPELQTYTLAMMDSATSAEALQLATALLGENGDTFAPMVESAANLDPYLASILVQMGLIEQQPDGTYTVTLDDQASSPMATLNSTMAALAEQIYILTTYLDDDETNDGIGHLEEQLIGLDTFVATPTVNVQDNASGPLANAKNLLDSLYDKTITVTTVGVVVGSFGPSAEVAGHGGVIDGHANGGMLARASGGSIPFIGAEGTGFELMRRGDGGGMQMLPTAGVYSAPQGSMVFPHGASMSMMDNMGGSGITVNVAGSVYGVDDLTATVAAAVAEGMVISRQRYVRGQAV